MACDEFCHAAEQETPDASLSMGAKDYQIGPPLCGGIDDPLSDVTDLDGGVHLEPCTAQLARNSFDYFTSSLLLVFQLRSVAHCHLGGS